VLHIALHREHETAQFVIRDKGVPDHPGQKSPKPARLVSGFFYLAISLSRSYQ
jgi:hypothetical protein